MQSALAFVYRKLTAALRGTGIGRFRALRRLDAFLISLIRPAEITVNGYRMQLDPKDSLRLSINGILEPCETALLSREIKTGHVVVDIGANIGYYTLLASRQAGDSGRVYAFEPDPQNFALLQKNIELNGCRNVTLVNKAVAESTGTLKLYLSDLNTGDHRAFATEETRSCISIECVSLDDYFRGSDANLDFIKMDIQGFECKALRGMQATLKRCKSTKLTAEFWPYGLTRAGDSPQLLLQLLQDYGFTLYEVNEVDDRIEPADIDRLFRTYTPDKQDFTNLYCERS